MRHSFRVIGERLQQVRRRIRTAAQQCGRDPDGITLIAVSKVKPATDIEAAYDAGQRHFGESYIQEFQQKREELSDLPGAVFHLIGKLQSNKTTPASKLFDFLAGALRVNSGQGTCRAASLAFVTTLLPAESRLALLPSLGPSLGPSIEIQANPEPLFPPLYRRG